MREGNVEGFLDATERLLIREGAAGISTRRLAREAGQNHGLVHYYFGSIDELLLQVVERFTRRLIVRQRAMYAGDVPFIEKWRAAMGYLGEDLASGYPKVWLELEALAWNRQELRERLVQVNKEWRSVLHAAFAKAARDYGLDEASFPVAAWTSLVMQFNHGMQVEQLLGIDSGHAELLAAIDAWLANLEKAKK